MFEELFQFSVLSLSFVVMLFIRRKELQLIRKYKKEKEECQR